MTETTNDEHAEQADHGGSVATDTPPADRVVTDAHTPDEHADHGWPDRKYIWLAVFLAVVTAAEIYAHSVDWLGPAFVPAMIIMMVIKFAAVVLFFMHLKFDSPIFGWLFYSGLALAVVVYIAFLLTFQFFEF